MKDFEVIEEITNKVCKKFEIVGRPQGDTYNALLCTLASAFISNGYKEASPEIISALTWDNFHMAADALELAEEITKRGQRSK